MRTTSRRITLPEKMLWFTGLGAAVSLFYQVQDYCSVPRPQSAVVIPYELFNLEGREEQSRELYYEINEGLMTISEHKERSDSRQAHAEIGNLLVKLLNFE